MAKRSGDDASLDPAPPPDTWYDRYQRCEWCRKWDSAGAECLIPGTTDKKWYCQECMDWFTAFLQRRQQTAVDTPVPEEAENIPVPMDTDSDDL